MLTHPTLEKLQQLRLSGMRQALEEQMHMPDIEALGFEERLGLLVDREYTLRESRRLKARLAKANCVKMPAWRTSITARPAAWIKPS